MTPIADWWNDGYWDGYTGQNTHEPPPGAPEWQWEQYDNGRYMGMRDRMKEKD